MKILYLGYIRLSLLETFVRKFLIYYFGDNIFRIIKLPSGVGSTHWDSRQGITSVLFYSKTIEDQGVELIITDKAYFLRCCPVYSFIVLTPIENYSRSVLSPMLNALKMIGQLLINWSEITNESKLYQSAVEVERVPMLVKDFGVLSNLDFLTAQKFQLCMPGLVGGPYSFVDSSYPAPKAQKEGCHPGIVLAGRSLSDQTLKYLAIQFFKRTFKKIQKAIWGKDLIFGITFEKKCCNIVDFSNNIFFKKLVELGGELNIYNPRINSREVIKELNNSLSSNSKNYILLIYNAKIHTVSHLEIGLLHLVRTFNQVIFGVKGFSLKQLRRFVFIETHHLNPFSP